MTLKETKVIETEIRDVLNQMWEAARKVDTDKMFGFFSDVLPVGFMEVGVYYPTREATISSFRKEFAQLKCQDIEVRDTQMAVLAPNVVIATQCCHFTSHFKVGNAFETDYAITFVLVKEDKGWKIIHSHESCPISVEE